MSNGAKKLSQPKPFQVDLDLSRPLSSAQDPRAIAVTSQMPPEDVLRCALEQGYGHICQKSGFAYDLEVQSASALIQSPELFRKHPVAAILTPDDLSEISERALLEVDIAFGSSSMKREVLDALVKAMESKGLPRTMVEDVLSVADEMFTNAVFNAPFIDLATQINPGVDRHLTEVMFEPGKAGRLFMAADESRMVVGCEDPFGSLNLHRYLSKIRDTYLRGPAATMNFGSGGAGLGSYIIFNSGCSLYFGVWPKQATLVCCVIPLGMSYRKRAQLPKHLHWIRP